MELLTSFFIALGLAMDAFAVSLGVGTSKKLTDLRSNLRLAFHFGIFQALMPIIGWLAGTSIAGLINNFDHWIAFILLVYVGAKMIKSGLDHTQASYPENPSKGRLLVILCIATSIDALAVGLSFALIKADIWLPTLVIGVVTFLLSYFGLNFGFRLGEKFGKTMEIIGGVILILIGLRILLSHIVI